MKNKKGFTLIELLAVIVILAIIALIATPIILNMIDNARKSAAVDSAYGYIEAIENYQAYEMLKGNIGLKEGIYNIAEETTIDNTKYKGLKELIKIKGSTPTGGKIGITKNGTVGTATMCINNYIIEYMNNKAEILSEDCGEMGAIVTYNINSEEWETSKTLEIVYPEGNYEYYYKLESGKATINEQEIAINEEIKTNTNIVQLELLENSKVTTWMIKNNKKISVRTYEETKIDNVELGTIEVATTSSYPTLTQYGINLERELTLKYEEQEGTSAYYSVDEGTIWKKYEGSTQVSGTSIQAKLVRDKSKRESEIVTSSISTATDALDINAYDGKEGTYHKITSGDRKMNITPEMYGKEIYLNIFINAAWNGDKQANHILFVDSKNTTLEIKSYTGDYSGTLTLKIPNDTQYLIFRSGSQTSFYINVKEITINDAPEYSVKTVYPKLTKDKIEQGYIEFTPIYFKSSVEKYYKIDDGEWKEYNDGVIKLYEEQTIYLKGVNNLGVESINTNYTASLNDGVSKSAYDKNESTYDNNTSGDKKMNISSEMYGEEIYLNIVINAAWNGAEQANHILFVDSKNTTLEIKSYTGDYSGILAIEIPNDTEYLIFRSGSQTDFYINVKEITINDAPEYNVKTVYPKLTKDKIEQGYIEFTPIYFKSSVEKYYKIDDGEWKEYNDGAIKLYEEQTIYLKGVNNLGVESINTSYTVSLNDSVSKSAYDKNESTYDNIASGDKKMNISSEMYGKEIYLNMVINAAWNGEEQANHILFVDSKNTTLEIKTYTEDYSGTLAIEIPNDTEYLIFRSGSQTGFYINIKEITIPSE